MTLGLAMIVKNEAAVIERTLWSVRDHIDWWCIQDNGSTDDTAAIIERILAGIPGELHHEPWVDFGTNRSQLMRRARGKCDWLLTLDADMTLDSVGPYPSADQGLVRFSGACDWALPFLVNGHHPWYYVGKAHEYITSDEPFTTAPATGWVLTHHGGGGNQDGKFETHLNLLGGDERTTFYRAQTFRDLGLTDAAVADYRRRVVQGGWAEEVFYAQLQVGLLTSDPNELLRAWDMRPTRAEPLSYLASMMRAQQRWASAFLYADTGLRIPYPSDMLFVDRTVYQWGLLLERSIAAWWLGLRELAYLDSLTLAEMDDLPAHVRDCVTSNLEIPQ